jgi:hypothetical protein
MVDMVSPFLTFKTCVMTVVVKGCDEEGIVMERSIHRRMDRQAESKTAVESG